MYRRGSESVLGILRNPQDANGSSRSQLSLALIEEL